MREQTSNELGRVNSEMTFDRTITVISVTVAMIASLAATVQSYVSWKGRYDSLKSAALSEVAKECHDLSRQVFLAMSEDKYPTAEQLMDIGANLSSLDTVVSAISPEHNEHLQAELIRYINDSISAHKDFSPASRAEEVNFLENIRQRCANIILYGIRR